MRMKVWCAAVAAGAAVVLTVGASAGGAAVGSARGTSATACFAHVLGAPDPEFYEHYTPGCTGHDEPELDPVSSAPHSAWNVTWRIALPAGGT